MIFLVSENISITFANNQFIKKQNSRPTDSYYTVSLPIYKAVKYYYPHSSSFGDYFLFTLITSYIALFTVANITNTHFPVLKLRTI